MKRKNISERRDLPGGGTTTGRDQRARVQMRLHEEIELLQKRLKQIGPDGDCGYENALIRFFHEQIDLRRQQLAGERK